MITNHVCSANIAVCSRVAHEINVLYCDQVVEIVAANDFVLQNMQFEFPAPLYELAQPAGKDEKAPAMLAMFCCKNLQLIGPWFSHGTPFEVSNTINRANHRGNTSISYKRIVEFTRTSVV